MIFFLREDTSYDDRDYINFTERLVQIFFKTMGWAVGTRTWLMIPPVNLPLAFDARSSALVTGTLGKPGSP
jgi:hypothetical protein